MGAIAAGDTRGNDTNNYTWLESRVTQPGNQDAMASRTGATSFESRVTQNN